MPCRRPSSIRYVCTSSFSALIIVLLPVTLCNHADTSFETSTTHSDLVMAAIDCSDVLGDIIAEWNEADLTDDLHIVFDMANLGLNDSNTNLEDELQLTFSLENATTGEEVKFESIALVLPSTNPYARSESNSSNDIEESNEIYASFKDETFGEVLNCFRPFSCLILMSYPNSPSNLNHQEVEIKVKNIPAMEIEAYIQLRLRDKIVVGDVLTIQNSVDDEFDSETPFEATFTSQAAWEETDASIWEGSEEIHYGEVDGKVDAFTNVDMDENLYESVFRDTDETEPNFDPGVMAEVDIEDAGIDTYTGVEADSNPVLPDKNIRVSDYTIEEEENAGGDKNSSKVAPSKNISNMSALPQRIHVRSITSPPEDNKTTVPPSHSKPPGQVRRGHKLRPKSTEAIMQQKKFRSLGGNPASQGAGVSKAKSASELRLGRRIKPHLKPGESSRKFRRSHRNMINISTNSTKHVSSITFLRLGHRRLRQKGSTSTNKMAKHRSATNQLRILGFGVNTSATSKPSITSLRRGFKRLPKRTEAQRTIVAKRRLDSTILEGFTRIKQRSRKPSAGGRPIKGSLRSMGTIIGSPNSKVISSSASRRVFGPRKELTKADKEKLAQSMKKFQSQHNLSSTSTSKSPKRRSSRRTKATKIHGDDTIQNDDSSMPNRPTLRKSKKAKPKKESDTDVTHVLRVIDLDPGDNVTGDVFDRVNYDELNVRSDEQEIESRSKHEGRFGEDYVLTILSLYISCGRNYSCFSYPAGCHIEQNCLVTTSFQQRGKRLHVALAAENTNYIAIGFSKDAYMGDDVVVLCKRAPGSDRVSIWIGYTIVGPTKRDYFSEENGDIRIISSAVYQGMLTCDFTLPLEMKLDNGLEVHFMKQTYNILLALGDDNTEPKGPGSITKHGFTTSSTEAYQMTSVKHTTNTHDSHILLTIHIVFGVVTYGFLVPMAILMARYGQQGFPYKSCKGYPTWVLYHISFQIATVLLNTLCIVLAFIGRLGSSFTSFSSACHFFVGVVLGLAVIGNAVAGFFIHRKRSKNMVLNNNLKWCHYIVGHAIFAFGALELVRGAYLRHSSVSCSFAIIAGFSLLYYSLAHVVLLLNTDYLRRYQKIQEPMIRAFIGPALHLDVRAPRCEYDVRRGTIIFMFFICAFFTLVLLAVIFISSHSCSPRDHDYIYGFL